jgi:hypothetical protein
MPICCEAGPRFLPLYSLRKGAMAATPLTMAGLW